MGEERKENLGTDEEQERVAGRRIVVVQPVVHVVRWIPPDPKGNLVVNASVMDDREVGLFFKMYKTLTTDQNLYVYGSSKSLGSWDRANAVELGWHENHRWSRDLVVPRSEILEGGPVEYKFFVAPYGEPGCTSEAREIETVNNRTIDTSEEQLDRDGCIEIYNAWNGIIMRLMIYHPLPEGRAMAVVGGHEQIGNWSGPRGMGLGPERRLLTGEIGRCWEVTFPLTEQEFKQNVQYRYVSLDQNDLTGIFEREPNRVRDFPNVGEISRGMNIAFDANFVGGIDFDEIADWNVVIGPYPQSKEDVDIMAQADVRAVVNVQTDGDFEKRKIDWAAISRAYEEHDIWVGRIQIIDFDGEDLQRHLKRAVEELHHFICHGRKTYVHCTAGMGRAPAVVVGYAVKYRGMDADAALAYIKQYRKVAAPNMSAIHQAIRDQRI
uniref:Uncharacterized protein n=1 Tax=Compsopogon caeruleus TaxID=31354 RepID=A0A7S1T9U4_9RHOD